MISQAEPDIYSNITISWIIKKKCLNFLITPFQIKLRIKWLTSFLNIKIKRMEAHSKNVNQIKSRTAVRTELLKYLLLDVDLLNFLKHYAVFEGGNIAAA